MELRHLRYFVAVAEELNFRKAAERLHVAGPTLSQQIKDLEISLDATLFERSTRQVHLTIPGEVLLEEARQLLAQAEFATVRVRAAVEGKLGTLRIGNARALSHSFMPATLNAFHKRHPEIEVNLVETDLENHITAVRNGALHIGLHLNLMEKLPAGICHLAVMKTQFHLVHGKGHRLAELRKVTLADLNHERFLSFSDAASSTHARLLTELLSTNGVHVGPVKIANGYEAFLAMIAGGDGISLLPKIAGMPQLEGLLIRPLQEGAAKMSCNVSAIWKDKTPAPLVQHFIDILKARRS